MRVRVNFTVDIDVENYRKKTGTDLTKSVIREDIQEQCRDFVMTFLKEQGIRAQYLGQNNKYDPKSRQTIHEEYVGA